MSNSPQIRTAIESRILAEASKHTGVTYHELRDRQDLSTSTSRDHCRRMASEGRLHCVKASQGCGLRWFAKKADAKAYQASQAKVQQFRKGMAVLPVQSGLSRGYDIRYQAGPDFAGGEFTALGPGRYIEAVT